MALEVVGCEVSEAEDGRQALDSICRGPVDLALLDLRMPALDGLEVLQRLRDESVDVPVVVVTALAEVPLAVRAIRAGAIDFLPKPVGPSALREMVFGVLARPDGGRTGSYRPRPGSIGDPAHRFGDHLAVARRVLEHGHIELAEHLVEQALDLDPDSAEANTLRGLLHEKVGEYHSSYRCYRRALIRDRRDAEALEAIRRYCRRFGLDEHNRLINPGAP